MTMSSARTDNLPPPESSRSAPLNGSQVAIQVLERAMKLLDVLALHSDPVALKDLAAATGLHASTTHRILNDLVVGRYVDRVDNGMYQLGMRLLELGSLVKRRLNVREVALEPMRELHRITGQTVNLSLRQGDEIVYIERAWSERSGMQVVRAIGGHAPLHLTSTGKLFLSVAEPRQVRALPCGPGSRAPRAIALPTLSGWNVNWRWCAVMATRATTKNWNWVCGVLPLAFTTIPASCRRGFRCPRPRIGCAMIGSPCCSAPHCRFPKRWATKPLRRLEEKGYAAGPVSLSARHKKAPAMGR